MWQPRPQDVVVWWDQNHGPHWCESSQFWEETLLSTEAAEILDGDVLTVLNMYTKPRELCFLQEGEALPTIIKQPARIHSTHKNAKTSLSPASQNTEATGDLPSFLWCGTTRCHLEAS